MPESTTSLHFKVFFLINNIIFNMELAGEVWTIHIILRYIYLFNVLYTVSLVSKRTPIFVVFIYCMLCQTKIDKERNFREKYSGC